MLFFNMRSFRKFLRDIMDKGGVATIGVVGSLLFINGKLPSFMGPVAYGITALGAFGFVRYITMNAENDKCEELLRELEKIKPLMEQKQRQDQQLAAICEQIDVMKSMLQGWRRDSSCLEDRITSIEQRQRSDGNIQDEATTSGGAAEAVMQGRRRKPDTPHRTPEDIVHGEIVGKIAKEIKQHHERFEKLRNENVQEQEMKTLLQQNLEASGSEMAKKEYARNVQYEQAMDYFEDELENITGGLEKVENTFRPNEEVYYEAASNFPTEKSQEPEERISGKDGVTDNPIEKMPLEHLVKERDEELERHLRQKIDIEHRQKVESHLEDEMEHQAETRSEHQEKRGKEFGDETELEEKITKEREAKAASKLEENIGKSPKESEESKMEEKMLKRLEGDEENKLDENVDERQEDAEKDLEREIFKKQEGNEEMKFEENKGGKQEDDRSTLKEWMKKVQEEMSEIKIDEKPEEEQVESSAKNFEETIDKEQEGSLIENGDNRSDEKVEKDKQEAESKAA